MGFLKKLFSGSPRPSSGLYNFSVRCSRCGDIIEGHVNLSNDLSAEYDGEQETFFARKVLMGSSRCFQQIEVELTFTSARELIERSVTGGEFV
jgi:hypothetical protein